MISRRRRAHEHPEAVLWDMDGTLVDTEPYWIATEFEIAERHGGTWTEEHARALVGADLLDAGAYIAEHAGLDLTPTEIVEELLDGVVAKIRADIPWRPGARELLAEMRRTGMRCALVTMSWRRFADAVIDALPEGSFDLTVTGDEVSRGKPHPEPYLVAAQRLGVDPRRCVAIEDSPTGAASATNAGCLVIGVPNVVEVPPAPGRILAASLTDIDLDQISVWFAEHRRPVRDHRRRVVTVAVTGTAAIAGVIGIGIGATRSDDPETTLETAAASLPATIAVDAWAPSWAWDRTMAEIDQVAPRLREISPFWLVARGVDDFEPFDPVVAEAADLLIDRAQAGGSRVVPSIVDGLDAGNMAAILGDPQQRRRHVQAILTLAERGGWDGVDLDYEQFAFADDRSTWTTTRPAWIAFVTELAAELDRAGRTLTVSVPPVYGPGETPDDGYWVYDHARLVEIVDRVRIMAYDFSTAAPGPIAPLDWVGEVVDSAVAVTGRPDRLVLGIPLYGYNWPGGTRGDCPEDLEARTGVTARSIDELLTRRNAAPVWNETTGEWAAVYDLPVGSGDCIQARRVHWVDATGAALRIDLARRAGLDGVALWALGYDDDRVWDVIDAVSP